MNGEHDGYGAFARVYDRALGDLFFRGAAAMVDELDRRYPYRGHRTHLDLCCGTGLAVRHFAQKGWASFGLDASFPMASRARERGGRVFLSDVRSFHTRQSFARITCLYDSLNHLMEESDMRAVFECARRSMDRSSLFWFDLNHPDSYPDVWGLADPYIARGDDYDVEIATGYSSMENLAFGHITGWVAIGGERVSIDEEHFQRAWWDSEIVALLETSGLEVVDIVSFDPFSDDFLEHDDVKQMYVVKKA